MQSGGTVTKARKGPEWFGVMLEGASVFGLICGAGIVAFTGKFLLGGVFAFFGLLMFARMKRGRVNRK